eukprot:CAMPEP_0181227548 /NCGR_PEP_ID=MMETSP1096-20121128/32848_1 /TAXON_ID=156174 ORGANISM="Chrysochromulina ericina, Strain CCMP281" /NCGR_SAMPLE_ID=MMETSP1096 /ASSEMBLY_ACC=CAM_ASM_000453 /LENGTH=191 /DNA_ID=CAMNT_0023320963 /DNA_START=366 /DNA_END=943 /DNA_ORIENTATION=+
MTKSKGGSETRMCAAARSHQPTLGFAVAGPPDWYTPNWFFSAAFQGGLACVRAALREASDGTSTFGSARGEPPYALGTPPSSRGGATPYVVYGPFAPPVFSHRVSARVEQQLHHLVVARVGSPVHRGVLPVVGLVDVGVHLYEEIHRVQLVVRGSNCEGRVAVWLFEVDAPSHAILTRNVPELLNVLKQQR